MKEYILNKELQTIKPGWKGNLRIDGEFVNFKEKDEQKTPADIFKWKVFSKNPQEEEKKADDFRLELLEGDDWINSTDDMIVWLGHAAFFIRLGGTAFITDPIFYNMSFIKRQVGIPCNVEKMKGIDYLLISHGHRDHFDKKTLWGSFIVRHKGTTIYFAGDTSVGDHFEEIARMFPEIDYCLLPVGAYKPVNIMQEAHLSPQEAYGAFKILGGKTFIPMHFGTYDLGDEPLGEPQKVLEAYADNRIKLLKVGEVVKW